MICLLSHRLIFQWLVALKSNLEPYLPVLFFQDKENDDADGYYSDGERQEARPEPLETCLPPLPEEPVPTQVLFEILPEGSNKGAALLSDGIGFSYTLKNHTSFATWQWQCSHRPAGDPCGAKISQKVAFTQSVSVIVSKISYLEILRNLYMFCYRQLDCRDR